MCPGEEESGCFDQGKDQTWGHRFYAILFRVLLQDLPASLMSSAALSLCSRAICQKDRMHYVRTLVVFLQNSSWIFHPLFIKKKKKVSLFSSTSFPSTHPATDSLTHDAVLDRSLGTQIAVSAQAPSPSCYYIFLKCILCKGEDQREAMLKEKAVAIDRMSVLEARLLLKDTYSVVFVIK